MLLAIDPGNFESAFVVVDETLRPGRKGIIPNEELLSYIKGAQFKGCDNIAIEMIAHYGTGMPAGKEVFDTCVWIGRFTEAFRENDSIIPQRIFRKDVKLNLCGTNRAKDGNVMRALIDRFARHDLKRGKGTKANPDWFYGFADDIWAAYAVAVTYVDKQREKKGA